MRIAINIIATNKYVEFVKPLCQSIEQYFYPHAERTIVLHTNQDIPDGLPALCSKMRFHKNAIEHQKWPFITLLRFHMFLQTQQILLDNDMCFYVDADAIFVNTVDIDLPTGMYACVHPGFKGDRGTPETDPRSTACIDSHLAIDMTYFYGGFFGGTSQNFINMCIALKSAINEDLGKHVIAVWHDESHLNKHFVHEKPAYVFRFPFAVAETVDFPERETSIVFLDKNSRGGVNAYRSA